MGELIKRRFILEVVQIMTHTVQHFETVFFWETVELIETIYYWQNGC